jgi:20S proteasome alpha/beta subunit
LHPKTKRTQLLYTPLLSPPLSLPFLLTSASSQPPPSRLHFPDESAAAAAAAVMECVIGVVGRDFAVVAADTSAVQSILVHKTDEDKVMVLDSHKLMGASGEPGDR